MIKTAAFVIASVLLQEYVLATDLDEARRYAPLVYFDRGERYFPSSMEFFLNNVKLIKKNGHVVQWNPRRWNIKTGRKSYFLESKSSLKCPDCTNLAFFRGQHPSTAPAYAILRRQGAVLDIIYWFFFPYNRGKRVCLGVYANNVCVFRLWKCFKRVNGCVGKYQTFGNHVGDWEHISIRLIHNRVHSLALSAHNFGGIYNFRGQHNNLAHSYFQRYEKGRRYIVRFFGTHPIVYSARGSHGLWSSPGRHQYKKICNGDSLADYTSHGAPWKTWERLRIAHWQVSTTYGGLFKPFNFLGRWGNRERGCGLSKKITGECILNDGPTAPIRKTSMTQKNPLSKRDVSDTNEVADARDIAADSPDKKDLQLKKDPSETKGTIVTEKDIDIEDDTRDLSDMEDVEEDNLEDVTNDENQEIEKRGWGWRRRRRRRSSRRRRRRSSRRRRRRSSRRRRRRFVRFRFIRRRFIRRRFIRLRPPSPKRILKKVKNFVKNKLKKLCPT